MAVLYGHACPFAPLIAQNCLMKAAGSRHFDCRNLTGLEGQRRRIVGPSRLQGKVEKRDERLMNGPRRLVAIQSEGGDEELATRPGALEKKFFAAIGKHQRESLGAF